MADFNHKTYVTLLNTSAELAKQYRIDCWLEKPEEKQVEILNKETKELTREELKEILTTAEIDFQWNAKTDKLKELALENNLI